MKSITGNTWGASKKILITIYKSLIRSILDYGCEAFYSASQRVLKKLDQIQYKALKIACGTFKGTSLASLQVEYGDVPLELRREKCQLKYSIKIKTTKDHPSSSILTDYWTNHFEKFNKGQQSFYNKTSNFLQNLPLLPIDDRNYSQNHPRGQKPLLMKTSSNSLLNSEIWMKKQK